MPQAEGENSLTHKSVEMKPTVLCICLAFCAFFAYSQSPYSELEKRSISFKKTNTDSFIFYNKLATNSYEEANNDFGAARCLQNLGFYYQETKKDYVTAFLYISLSLEKWKKLGDTVNEANLVKYLALTCEYLGYHKLALEKTETAISMFKTVQYEPGVYVAYFDLGIIHFNAGDVTKARQNLLISKKYWLNKKNEVRLFAINNYILKCIKEKSDAEFIQIVEENNAYLQSSKIPTELSEVFKELSN